jgi:hypothetical protein
MKLQHSSTVVWKTLIAAVAVLMLAGLAGSAFAAPPPNQITVHNQELNNGVVVIDSVTAAQDGWVAIYKRPNFTEIVGYAPVRQGTTKNVKVTIDTAKVGDLPTLWTRLHVDNVVKGVFEWGFQGKPYNDAPVLQNGQPVVASFATSSSAGPASTAATPVATKTPVTAKPAAGTGPIVIADQDLNSGIIVANSVTSPASGWLVIYKNPDNLTAGEIVGYAPVRQGANSNVKITLDMAKVGDLPVLWAVLQADKSLPGVFEWGLKGQTYRDTPVVANGHNVMIGFGTAAAMAAGPAASASATPRATKAPATTKPAATTASLVIKNQDLNTGIALANSVTSPVNGWLVIYKDQNNLTAGEIVGYAPVRQGANSNVKVTLDMAKVGDLPTLWAVLQADSGLPGVFEWGLNGQAYHDNPIVVKGRPIMTAFGTAANQ